MRHENDTAIEGDGPTRRDRIRGAFLGCALGDAFGRPFEGASRTDLASSDAIARRVATDEAWSYSDDTEMMLGVAESILERGDLDPEHLLRTLARNCDPARGYGHGTRRAFEAARRGEPWRRAAFTTWPDGSRGNGGAVRVVPIACLHSRSFDRLDYAAQASAAVTHAHRIARVGCMVHARAVAIAISEDGISFDAARFLDRVDSNIGDEPVFRDRLRRVKELLASHASTEAAVEALGNGVTADESVPMALFCFARSPRSFESAVVDAVSAGGDTDTIGAMTGTMAGALLGAGRLPTQWLARLENGPRGRDFIGSLADRIADLTTR